MDQLSFFSTTLTLRGQYDAGAALSRAGITPGSTNTISAINKAFQEAYGAMPLMGCDTSTNALKEVGWCIDKAGKMVRDIMQHAHSQLIVDFCRQELKKMRSS